MTHPATPLVSICIPTYNRSRYLASLLESLVGQFAAFPYPYELVIADMDFDQIEEVRRTWQFYRDRRPETYGDMVRQLP